MSSSCWLVPWRCFSVVLCIAVGWCGIDSVFICSDFVCCALCYVVFSGIVDPWVFVFQKDAVGTDSEADVFFEFCLVETNVVVSCVLIIRGSWLMERHM